MNIWMLIVFSIFPSPPPRVYPQFNYFVYFSHIYDLGHRAILFLRRPPKKIVVTITYDPLVSNLIYDLINFWDESIRNKWLPQPLKKLTWWGVIFLNLIYFYIGVVSPRLEKFWRQCFSVAGVGE